MLERKTMIKNAGVLYYYIPKLVRYNVHGEEVLRVLQILSKIYTS
jgi:hypothetical protein